MKQQLQQQQQREEKSGEFLPAFSRKKPTRVHERETKTPSSKFSCVQRASSLNRANERTRHSEANWASFVVACFLFRLSKKTHLHSHIHNTLSFTVCVLFNAFCWILTALCDEAMRKIPIMSHFMFHSNFQLASTLFVCKNTNKNSWVGREKKSKKLTKVAAAAAAWKPFLFAGPKSKYRKHLLLFLELTYC